MHYLPEYKWLVLTAYGKDKERLSRGLDKLGIKISLHENYTIKDVELLKDFLWSLSFPAGNFTGGFRILPAIPGCL